MNSSKQGRMDKKAIIFLLVGLTLASVQLAEAQQTGKVHRIGVLLAPSRSFYSDRVEAFRQGLRELGYVEGPLLLLFRGTYTRSAR
jgi:putative ABC transport system substrate-binding protein